MANKTVYNTKAFVTSARYDYAAADHSTITLVSGERTTINWSEIAPQHGYLKGLDGQIYIPISFGTGYCCLDEGETLSDINDQHINVGLEVNIFNTWTHHQENEDDPLLRDPSIEGNYYINPELLVRNLTDHDISFNAIYLPVLYVKWQLWATNPVRSTTLPVFNDKITEAADSESGYSKINYFNETLIDISEDTVTSNDLLVGESAHNSEGKKIIGLNRINVALGFYYTVSPNPAIVVPAHGNVATGSYKWNRNTTDDRLLWDTYSVLTYPDSSHTTPNDALPIRAYRIGGSSSYNANAGYLASQSMRFMLQNPTDEDITVGHIKAACSCIYGVTSWMRYYNWQPPATE